MQGCGCGGLVEVDGKGSEAVGVGVDGGCEGKDEGHQHDRPGKFVVGGVGEVSHVA